ncbi:MAG: YfhO family protein [Archangium sp.]
MRRRSWLLWLAPSWLLLAWLFQGVLLGEAAFSGDMVLCFLPLKKLISESFAAGAFPEWWPYDGLGQPMASLPIASLFHPTTVLYALLPLKAAWALQTLFPVFLAPIGTWALARTLGLRQPVAAFVTTVVAISFWHVLLSSQTQMHLAAASLPWFWREAIRVFRSRRGSVVVLALATANMVVGGDPMLLELACLGLLLLLRWSRWRRPTAWGRLVGAGALGLSLGGVQLVPMLYFFPHSPRAAGLAISTDDLWAVRAKHLAGLVWPTEFGKDLLFDSLYVGAPVLLLAGLALATRWRWRWRLAAVVMLFALISGGRALPVWHLLSAVLPGWSGYQFPVKALGPAVLPLALLAGQGLQSSLRRFAWPGFVLSGVLLLIGGVMTAVLQVAAGALALMLEHRARRSAKKSMAVATPVALVVTLLLCVDVCAVLGPVSTRPHALLETPPPLVQALADGGAGLERGFYEWSWNVPPALKERVPDWERRENELMVLLGAPASGALYGLPSSQFYLVGVTRRVFDVSRATRDQSYLWRLRLSQVFGANVRLQMLTSPPQPNTLAVDEDLGAAVVRLPDALPRAYVAFAATPVEEDVQVVRLNAGFQAGLEVLVAPGDTLGIAPLTAQPRAPVPVAIHRGVDRITADVTVDAAGLLVLNEAWAPGWRATRDGQPLQLVPANHAVMAVAVQPGTQHVEFVYETPGLRAGAALTVASALSLMAWAALRRTRRRPASKPSP